MNIEKAKQLFIQLEEYLKRHGNNSIISSYQIVKNTIDFLQSDESEMDKEEIIIHNYKMLYSNKGGLSEFFIWDNDFSKRKELNEPLEKIHNELWELVKDYI